MNRKIYSKVVVQWNAETNQYDTVVSEESFIYNGEMALLAESPAYTAGANAAAADPANMMGNYDAASWNVFDERSDYELGWLEAGGMEVGVIGSDGPPSQDYQDGSAAATNGWPYEGPFAYNESIYASAWIAAGGDPAQTPMGGGGGGGGGAGSGSVSVDTSFSPNNVQGYGFRQGGDAQAQVVSISGSDNGSGAIGFDSSSATFEGLVSRGDMGIKGQLSVEGASEFGGALTLYQGANVTGDITTYGNIVTTGAIEDPMGQNRLQLDNTNGMAGLDLGNTSIGDGKFQTWDVASFNRDVTMNDQGFGDTNLEVNVNSIFNGPVTMNGGITGSVAMTGDFTLQGNFSVAGTTTTINSTAVELGDRIIDLAGDGTGFAGLRVKDSDPFSETSGSLVYDANTNKWKAGQEAAEIELVDLSSPQSLSQKSISTSDLDLSGQSLTIDDSHADQIAGQTSTTELPEGTNLYHTTARARASVSVTDAGGDGSLAYNNSTGVITYTGPAAAEVRAHLSATDTPSIDLSLIDGNFKADAIVDDSSIETSSDNGLQVKANGITNDMLAGSIASTKIAELNNFDTADLAEGSNLYFTEARARASLSVTNSEGDDSALSYDAATGVFTFDGVTEAEVKAHLSAVNIDGDALSTLSYADGVFTLDGLGADEIRAQVSVTDTGGDGSLSYDAATGVITYTGPSAAETHAHLSVADSNSIDMTYDGSGEFSADVKVDDSSIEIDATNGLQVKSEGITNDMLAGSISNARLVNSSMDIAGSTVALGGSITADAIAQAMSSDIISGDQVEGGTIAAIQIDALTVQNSLVPLTDQSCALGSPTHRFSDMYTGDLHLKNERGNWTIFEESDHLRVRNNLTGQTFKMAMTPIEE